MFYYFHLLGIETKFKNLHYPVIIAPTHVPEMLDIVHSDLGIQFGASTTLTTIDDTLKEAINQQPGQ